MTVSRDDGAYTCIAINAAGEATATVDLKIIPLPHRGGAAGNTGNNNPKNNRNTTNGILRTDPGSSDISTGKNGGINGAGRGGEVEDGRRGEGEEDEAEGNRVSGAERSNGGSVEDDDGGGDEEGIIVGVQGVTSTSAQIRWDLGRLSTAYVVWMYQIQYNCTADETLIYR